MIKLTAKLTLISRAGVLNENEENLLRTAMEKVHSLVLTIVSFFKVNSFMYLAFQLIPISSGPNPHHQFLELFTYVYVPNFRLPIRMSDPI